METETKVAETIQSEVKCTSCGSGMVFDPGTSRLKCGSCSLEIDIEKSDDTIEEIDFDKFLNDEYPGMVREEIVTVRCTDCGAHTTFDPHVVSDYCPFCGTPIVAIQGEHEARIRPGSLLPFRMDRKSAENCYGKWIKGLWFAPNDLQKNHNRYDRLQGVYIPYWTYDSETFSTYTGQKGVNYTTTQHYTTVQNGKTVSRTRTVTKTRWYFVSGKFNHTFDDVLVLASRSLQKKYAEKLSPWNLKELESYNPKFLTGFRAETYQVDLPEGFAEAKVKMERTLREETQRRIGGDHQRILSLHTKFEEITFKHTLLPVWISVFRYNGKNYRFLVNGQTGKVCGERPYSAWKITFFVLFIFIILAVCCIAGGIFQS